MDSIYVALGGFIGAVLRYIFSLAFVNSGFPSSTFLINLSGSFIIGFVLIIALERATISPNFRLFFATGLLGAFTTFSTYTLDTLLLLNSGYFLTAINYYLWSVILGIIFAALGAQLGKQTLFYIDVHKERFRAEEWVDV